MGERKPDAARHDQQHEPKSKSREALKSVRAAAAGLEVCRGAQDQAASAGSEPHHAPAARTCTAWTPSAGHAGSCTAECPASGAMASAAPVAASASLGRDRGTRVHRGGTQQRAQAASMSASRAVQTAPKRVSRSSRSATVRQGASLSTDRYLQRQHPHTQQQRRGRQHQCDPQPAAAPGGKYGPASREGRCRHSNVPKPTSAQAAFSPRTIVPSPSITAP